VKAALGFRGLPVRPDVRAPLRPLPAEPAGRLRAELGRLLGGDLSARPIRAPVDARALIDPGAARESA
jgi:hypothetical protein